MAARGSLRTPTLTKILSSLRRGGGRPQRSHQREAGHRPRPRPGRERGRMQPRLESGSAVDVASSGKDGGRLPPDGRRRRRPPPQPPRRQRRRSLPTAVRRAAASLASMSRAFARGSPCLHFGTASTAEDDVAACPKVKSLTTLPRVRVRQLVWLLRLRLLASPARRVARPAQVVLTQFLAMAHGVDSLISCQCLLFHLPCLLSRHLSHTRPICDSDEDHAFQNSNFPFSCIQLIPVAISMQTFDTFETPASAVQG